MFSSMKYFALLGMCAVALFPISVAAAASAAADAAASAVAVAQPCVPSPVEPKPADPAPITYPDSIRISEIFPDPEGDESAGEFIELYNEGSVAVDLTGWKLSDATARVYTLAVEDFTSMHARPGEYFVVYRSVSGVALNNSGGDQVELYGPDDVLLDVVAYPTAKAGQTWAMDDIGDGHGGGAPPGSAPDDGGSGEDDAGGGGATDADVVLSEMLPDPEGSDTTGEWIELWNS